MVVILASIAEIVIDFRLIEVSDLLFGRFWVMAYLNFDPFQMTVHGETYPDVTEAATYVS